MFSRSGNLFNIYFFKYNFEYLAVLDIKIKQPNDQNHKYSANLKHGI